jgi:hypothetical protein
MVLCCSCSRPSPAVIRQQPPAQKQKSVEEYAAGLRKDYDSVQIYAVSNRYEVWCMGGLFPGKWKDAETLDQARQIVNDYYLKWAENCIGPTPPGKRIE